MTRCTLIHLLDYINLWAVFPHKWPLFILFSMRLVQLFLLFASSREPLSLMCVADLSLMCVAGLLSLMCVTDLLSLMCMTDLLSLMCMTDLLSLMCVTGLLSNVCDRPLSNVCDRSSPCNIS